MEIYTTLLEGNYSSYTEALPIQPIAAKKDSLEATIKCIGKTITSDHKVSALTVYFIYIYIYIYIYNICLYVYVLYYIYTIRSVKQMVAQRGWTETNPVVNENLIVWLHAGFAEMQGFSWNSWIFRNAAEYPIYLTPSL